MTHRERLRNHFLFANSNYYKFLKCRQVFSFYLVQNSFKCATFWPFFFCCSSRVLLVLLWFAYVAARSQHFTLLTITQNISICFVVVAFFLFSFIFFLSWWHRMFWVIFLDATACVQRSFNSGGQYTHYTHYNYSYLCYLYVRLFLWLFDSHNPQKIHPSHPMGYIRS